ncbi:MAG: hypothetical protein ABIT96_13145 [Ferruginibacter sp.]
MTTFLYIDPGSGSMLIQMIIGAAVAAGVFVKRIRYGIASIFSRKNKGQDIEEEN